MSENDVRTVIGIGIGVLSAAIGLWIVFGFLGFDFPKPPPTS